MKKLFFFAAIISFACPFVACKSKKAAKTTANAETTKTTMTEEPAAQKYRLIVSFISKGAGTDSDKRKAFLSFIESHSKKPAYTAVNWGREGETDYCFNLSEFLKKEQIEFINQVKGIIGSTDMVSVAEDAECPHKGR